MKKGFTLIELLVVIAIIAILAAILFPVFAQAREKGRQAACTSNVKQISQAILMYAQDYDDSYLITDESAGFCHWYKLLQPYIKSDNVFKCPSFMNQDNSATAHNIATDYIINAYCCHGTSMAKILNPADQICIAERAKNHDDEDYHAFTVDGEAPDGWEGAIAADRHNGGAVYGFCDGHAKWIKWDQTISPVNMHNTENWP
ncbi:MAG: prepilin-type N-terminal cleavage/methylation domain-containing protein [Armatimonadota bacterium]|nr:hypothetical protein [Armatimonadota bacterium]